jgi:hypothetical protein
VLESVFHPIVGGDVEIPPGWLIVVEGKREESTG